MKLYRFLIFGRVQGVYYRKFISLAAMKKQIHGYVKNLPDGTVEAVAELIEDDLQAFIALLRAGSPSSEVEDIQFELIDDASLIYDGFKIR